MTDKRTDHPALSDTLALPNEMLISLGQVAMAFSRLDLGLEMLFASMIDRDQRIGRSLLSLFGGLSARVNAIDVLYVAKFGTTDEFYPELSSLVSEVLAAGELRHAAIHSTYAIGDYGSVGRIRTLRPKKGFRVDAKDNVTVESLRATAVAGLVAFDRVMRLLSKLSKSGRAFPSPKGPQSESGNIGISS